MMIKGVLALSSLILVLQIPALTPDIITNVDKLSLTGFLIVLVGVLWRQLKVQQGKTDEKDSYIFKIIEITTKALETSSDSNRELRTSVQSSIESKDNLKDSIDQLRTTIDRYVIISKPI